MKKLPLSSITLLLMTILVVQDSRAEDYTRRNLPKGALARLGKGDITGGVAYSPDGTRLAVGSSIGIWLYDDYTGAVVALLTGHTDKVLSVSFSPDGRTLASGSGWLDNTIRLWDVASGQQKALLKVPREEVELMAFSPDGKTLASGGKNTDGIRLWDVESGQQKALLKGQGWSAREIAFSSDGKTIATNANGEIRLWDVASGQLKTSPEGYMENIRSISFSPDDVTLASSNWKAVRLWDVASGQLKATLRTEGEAYQVSFSPDGTTLASGNAHTVSLLDVASGQLRATLEGHTGWVLPVSFSPDGTVLASGSRDNTVRLWDVASGQLKYILAGHTHDVNWVSFSPDGQTLASGSYDNTVRLWDVASGQSKATVKGHSSSVNSVSFSPDGRTLASGSDDETIRLWDVATGQEISTLEGHTRIVESVSFSPDGRTLASGSDDETIRLWDVNNRQLKATLKGHSSSVNSVSFSPDGRTLASGEWGTVRLWDVATGQEMAVLRGHEESVLSVSFSPDGRTLASGSGYGAMDESVRLWDVESGQQQAVLQRETGDVNSVSFSPDGRTLAGTTGGDIRLWDVESGQEIAMLQGERGNLFSGIYYASDVFSVAYSQNGMILASGSPDNTVRLWDVESGQEIATLQGHTDQVKAVSFSSDSQTLASGSSDGTILLWDMELYFISSWCSSTQTVEVSFWLQENSKTASICRDEANTLIYSFGILGGEPELEYKGPILGQVSARAALWGEGVDSLAGLAAAVTDESSTWFNPDIDVDAIAQAAQSRETNGFYVIEASTDLVDQSVYIFRKRGWEYAISSTSSQSMSVGEDELEEYSSHEITVLSPEGEVYHPDSLQQAYTRWGLPEGASLRLGRGALNGFAFTPDGQWLTLSSSVGVWYYDVAEGAVAALQVEGMPPFAGVVSPDSSLFTSMRWRTFKPGLDVLSEDRATLASATGDTIRVRDTATGEIRFEEPLGTRIQAVAYRSDPFALAAAIGDTILVWQEGEGGVKTRSTFLGHTDEVRALTILPDGATLASASIARIEEHSSYFGSGEIRLWDLAGERGAVSRRLIVPEYTCCLDRGNMAFSADGSTLAAGGYETVLLWDVTTGQLAARLEDPDLSGNIIAVAFSPDGQTVASRINTLAEHVRLWDIATGEFRDIGSQEHMSLAPIGFSSDGSLLATQSHWEVSIRNFEHEGTTVFFWDTRAGQHKTQVVFSVYDWAGVVRPARLSPDFRTVAVRMTSVEKGGYESHWVALHDVATGRRVALSHEAEIKSVAFSPDGEILVSWIPGRTWDGKHYDETIRLWDVATGDLLLAASEDTVVTLRHPATSQAIATISEGRVAFASGGPRATSPPVMATAEGDSAWVSPDWSVVATVSRGTILLWDMMQTRLLLHPK